MNIHAANALLYGGVATLLAIWGMVIHHAFILTFKEEPPSLPGRWVVETRPGPYDGWDWGSNPRLYATRAVWRPDKEPLSE